MKNKKIKVFYKSFYPFALGVWVGVLIPIAHPHYHYPHWAILTMNIAPFILLIAFFLYLWFWVINKK